MALDKSQISSIYFVINRFFMKLFNTNNIEIVKCCQQEFCFSLPSITLAHRTEIFLGKIRQCDNLLVFLLYIFYSSLFCYYVYLLVNKADQKTLVNVRYYTLWHYRLSMYFSSHASVLVYLIACAFGLLWFICCFLVKLYILLNCLI